MANNRRKPIADRLWAKVDRRGPDECWNCNAAIHPDGHARIGGFDSEGRYKMFYAHRISYELHIGPIPPGLVVMHKCDNPRCVNPAHLQLGTDADNHRDCWNKGRSPFKPSMPGASHPNAKITPAISTEVLRLRREGWTQDRVAAYLHISKGSIYYIERGMHWSLR